MAGGVRSNSNNLGLGLKEIPMGSRKMVLSLKEIVNCPEAEIYAMLKDCNMDPNEAVNRLLSQDPFHEVKSKREKKKENKDTSEGRSRGSSSSSNRGGRSGTNRYPRDGYSGSTATAYNPDFGATQAKPAYKKDNGPASASYTGYGGGSGYTSTYKQPPVNEAATYTENKVSVVGKSEGVSTQQYQSSGWGGVPGQLSMADIVKMGKPQNRAPPHHQQHNVDDWGSVPQQQHGSGSMNDEWPLMEPTSVPTSTTVNVSELTSLDDTKLHQDSASSTLQYDNSSWHDQPDEIQAVDDIAVAADESVHEDNDYDNNNDNASYQTEHDEVEEEVDASESSVTENMQQLNIVEEIESGDLPSVVIPDHLQVQTADCSHLSFGSFRVGAPISAPLTSAPVEESAASEPDASVVDHSEPRNSEYYGEEQFRNAATDGSLFHRAGENSANYDSNTSASQQQEGLKTENPVVIEHGNQYAYPSTTPGGYTFENNNQQQQQQAMYNQAQSQSQSQQEHAQFSNVMGYTNSPLAANVHPGRESEIQYSPFAINQSMPAKYGNSSASAISMPEALRTVGLSSGQPITGANVATGPGLPQQLLHPYSQHNIGLSPYSNMISYPFIHHPTYPYMPNAFQQAFPNNSSYHPQSLSGILPQYKNSGASVSSVQPQSATVPSGYGAFANTTTIPGNFPPSAQSAAAIGYEELLNSQYKENSHLMSLQQQQVNENSAMWHQGSGSRSMSGVPGSTYYNLQGQGQGQNQQQQVGGGGYNRQGQGQGQQNYGGNPGYANFYQQQSVGGGMSSLEQQHQQQNTRDGAAQGQQQPKQQQQQSQQMWQNGY